MLLISIGILLSICLSQIVASCYLSAVLLGDERPTNGQKIASYFASVFDWPHRLLTLIIQITNPKYTRLAFIALAATGVCLIVNTLSWHLLYHQPILIITACELAVLGIWWVLVNFIGGFIMGVKTGTIFID